MPKVKWNHAKSSKRAPFLKEINKFTELSRPVNCAVCASVCVCATNEKLKLKISKKKGNNQQNQCVETAQDTAKQMKRKPNNQQEQTATDITKNRVRERNESSKKQQIAYRI